MIQPNELRIGNLIDYEGTTHIVTGILDSLLYSRWHKQSQSEVDYHDYYRNYKPINLTTEILEKFGFEKVEIIGENVYYKKEDIGIIYFDGACDFCFIEEDDEWNNFKDFYFLHQLQNLWFSIKGEEL